MFFYRLFSWLNSFCYLFIAGVSAYSCHYASSKWTPHLIVFGICLLLFLFLSAKQRRYVQLIKRSSYQDKRYFLFYETLGQLFFLLFSLALGTSVYHRVLVEKLSLFH